MVEGRVLLHCLVCLFAKNRSLVILLLFVTVKKGLYLVQTFFSFIKRRGSRLFRRGTPSRLQVQDPGAFSGAGGLRQPSLAGKWLVPIALGLGELPGARASSSDFRRLVLNPTSRLLKFQDVFIKQVLSYLVDIAGGVDFFSRGKC